MPETISLHFQGHPTPDATAAQKKAARDASRAQARADTELNLNTSELTAAATKPVTLINEHRDWTWVVRCCGADLLPGMRIDGEYEKSSADGGKVESAIPYSPFD
jgi:hypothetical protein